MAWEYLKTKEFDVRYAVAAAFLPEDKIILDLNCGEPNFRKFIKHKKYYANDINDPDDITGVSFMHCKDDEVGGKKFKINDPIDFIVLFGYGGGEFTGEPLESKTAGESLVRMANEYNPKGIIIEMAQKWQTDFRTMTHLKIKLKKYKVVAKIEMNFGGVHYHNKRLMEVFKIK